jgi:hypothetical protein
MYRLHGQDASWLYKETLTTPMHTLKIFLPVVVQGEQLGRDRLLWQFWIIEGLEDGRIALVQKIHHAVADGMASLSAMTRVWQSSYHEHDSVLEPWTPESIPSNTRLFCDALVDHFKFDIGNLPSFFKAIGHIKWAIKPPAGGVVSSTLSSVDGNLQRTRWNRALSSRRSFTTAQLDLDALKSVKNKLGGTLNDVVLAMVGRDTVALLAHYIPAALQRCAANRGYRKRLVDNKKFRPPTNLAISNVPGPREKFSTRGNLVDSIYSSGPLVEAIGLNITVWSYAGKMNFTATGCMRGLPDIHNITTGLDHALQERQDAAA